VSAPPQRPTAPGVVSGETPVAPARKPPWLRVKVPPARAFRATAGLLEELRLHTVCDEARCPNKGECFAAGTATFLILGDACTRDCRFCSVHHGVRPGAVDFDEPRRVAQAAARLGLRHVVITSVTRDDLEDGGAAQFAAAVRETRTAVPEATIEVLTPDFGGSAAALDDVLAAGPHVFNHNLETVPRLYAAVRPQAGYGRSLDLLRRAAGWAAAAGSAVPPARDPARPLVKTGIMLGLGETDDEVESVLHDCLAAGVDVVTIGQYLRPAGGCAPVVRYVTPAGFDAWTAFGERLGLTVVAGPLVRSSYRAGEVLLRAAARAEVAGPRGESAGIEAPRPQPAGPGRGVAEAVP
jgi:lipoyl synthase